MTTVDFIEKELRKCRKNLGLQKSRGSPEIQIKNIEEKIFHYENALKILKAVEKK
jgi:uncharacterized protein (DUF2164 family)